MSDNVDRLDASESIFFKRQLESIDARLYSLVYPDNLARTLIPTITGVDPDMPVYTWRMVKQFGEAAFIDDFGGSVPRSDVDGEEQSQTMKSIGSAYGWTLDEIRYANKTGVPLDSMKALSCRNAVDTKLDVTLALGDTPRGLSGILNLSNTTTFTLSTKAGGGGVAWASATPDEIVADVTGMLTKIIDAMKASGGPMFQRFRICLPVKQYGQIAQRRMGDGSDTTILKFLLANSPYIESINAWHRCTNAGSGGAQDRMIAFPPSEEVVGALVPLEFQTTAPQQENLAFKVIGRVKTGGVICRYPVAVGYADGL